MNMDNIIKKYGTNGIFTIAEIGNNHMGDVSIAREMIDAAARAGASAVKFQKRANSNLFQKNFADTAYIGKNSFGSTYLEHREKVELSIDEMKTLNDYANEQNVLFFATPFDEESLVELESINSQLYKVASADIVNHSLLEAIANTGKPIILSTGGATMEEVKEAVGILDGLGCSYCILQCTAAYPVEPKDMELKVIETFKQNFPNIHIGLSDHQSGISMALIAYMLGARIFEKHFTLHRSWKGTDQSFSLEPEGFRKMVRDLQSIDAALGDGIKKPLAVEQDPIFKMRKSIVLAEDVPAGVVIERRHLEFRCPWNGLAISQLKNVIGKRLINDVPAGHVLRIEDLQ